MQSPPQKLSTQSEEPVSGRKLLEGAAGLRSPGVSRCLILSQRWRGQKHKEGRDRNICLSSASGEWGSRRGCGCWESAVHRKAGESTERCGHSVQAHQQQGMSGRAEKTDCSHLNLCFWGFPWLLVSPSLATCDLQLHFHLVLSVAFTVAQIKNSFLKWIKTWFVFNITFSLLK